MAIHTMCSESEAHYSMPYYWGHERGLVRHAKGCPHYADCQVCVSDDSYRQEIRVAGLHTDCITEGRYSEKCSGPFEALFMQVSYEGCVLETRERNGRDDSDFYARVWDESEQRILEVEYASTRGWTYPNSATVDATPDVVAKAEAYLDAQHERARVALLESPNLRALESANSNGYMCELKVAVRTRASVQEPCRKCSATGHWTNPRNSRDQRPCFACNGTKQHKAPAPKGSPMTVHPAGKRGLVRRTFEDKSRYGTWVRSQRVELQAADGELFTVDISKVRLVEVSP